MSWPPGDNTAPAANTGLGPGGQDFSTGFVTNLSSVRQTLAQWLTGPNGVFLPLTGGTLTGDLTTNGALSVGENTALGKNLTVAGSATFSGVITAHTSAQFGSNLANNITLAGGAAGFTPSITVAGSDTDVSLNLLTQGAGTVNIGGNNCTVNQGGTLTAQSVTANPITAGTFVVGTSAGPNIITGAGVPGFTEPKGSIYLRTGGGVGSTLYVSQGGGTWNAVAGV